MLHGQLIALALAAATPWSEPVSLGTPALAVSSPAIAFARDGTALLSANTSSRVSFTGRLVIRAPSGAVTETRLPEALAADPVVYGRGQFALLHIRRSSRPGGGTRLSVSFGTTAAPVSGRRPRVLSTYALAQAEQGDPAIAVSAQGEAAVAWVEFLQRGRVQGLGIHRLRLAIRTPGGAFGRPRTLATANGGIQGVALAYGRAGDLLAAYGAERSRGRTRRRTVEARLRRSRRGFGPARVLGPHEGLVDLSATMAPTGRAVVAWGTQDGGEGAEKPYRVRAAIRAPGSATFSRTQLLDPGATVDRVPGRLVLGLAPDGSATVAWSNVVGSSNPVRVATTGPRTRFRPAGQVAPNGAVGDVAVSGDGTAVLVWDPFTEFGPEGGQVQAALRPPGAPAFGSAENVSAPEPTELSHGGAAFDPATGRAAVVWSRLAEPGPGAVWLSVRTP